MGGENKDTPKKGRCKCWGMIPPPPTCRTDRGTAPGRPCSRTALVACFQKTVKVAADLGGGNAWEGGACTEKTCCPHLPNQSIATQCHSSTYWTILPPAVREQLGNSLRDGFPTPPSLKQHLPLVAAGRKSYDCSCSNRTAGRSLDGDGWRDSSPCLKPTCRDLPLCSLRTS